MDFFGIAKHFLPFWRFACELWVVEKEISNVDKTTILSYKVVNMRFNLTYVHSRTHVGALVKLILLFTSLQEMKFTGP